VVARVVAGREAADGQGEDERDAERADRPGEAQAGGEHQARERRGRDAVGVEGQTTQDDPHAEDPGAAGEQQDLPEAALHEGEGERLEHRQDGGR